MTEQVIFTNPTHERTVAEYVTYSHKEAGFWMRFWAFLIDTLLVSAVIGIVVNPFFYLFDWDLNATNWYAPIVIISGIVYYGYFVLMTKFFAQTVGKMIFGLKVLTDSGEPLNWSTVIFRECIGRFLSNAFMKVPYLIVIFTPQHKAVHDFAADTYVIHEDSYKELRKKRYVEQEASAEQIALTTDSEQLVVQDNIEEVEKQSSVNELQITETSKVQETQCDSSKETKTVSQSDDATKRIEKKDLHDSDDE